MCAGPEHPPSGWEHGGGRGRPRQARRLPAARAHRHKGEHGRKVLQARPGLVNARPSQRPSGGQAAHRGPGVAILGSGFTARAVQAGLRHRCKSAGGHLCPGTRGAACSPAPWQELGACMRLGAECCFVWRIWVLQRCRLPSSLPTHRCTYLRAAIWCSQCLCFVADVHASGSATRPRNVCVDVCLPILFFYCVRPHSDFLQGKRHSTRCMHQQCVQLPLKL